MITRQEIMDSSREFGLSPNVIEKDYVLGWILDGISNHSKISGDWVFKGGTCLKKGRKSREKRGQALKTEHKLKTKPFKRNVEVVSCFIKNG